MDAKTREQLRALDMAKHLQMQLNRRTLLRTAGAAAGALAVMPLLAACGGDDDDDVQPTTPPGVATATSAPAATPTAGSGAARPGGTLTFGVEYDTPVFDPLRTISSARGSVAIYESLVIRNDAGEYQPWLATGWEVAADGSAYTFTLRDDVKFQDDTPFNAAAVKWFFDKAMDPEGIYAFRSTLAPVDEVTEDDEFTASFRLNGPFSGILEYLGEANYMYTGMLSPTAYEAAGDDFGVTTAVGTGPFNLESWVPNDTMTFVRNDAYAWGPAARAENQGPATLEKLVYRYIPEAAARVAALETGQFDILFATPVQDYERLKATGDFEFHTPPQYGGSLLYVGPNKSRATFQDLKVRQAINYAIDKESIQRVVFSINGQVAYGNLPPHFTSAYPNAESIGYHYNPDTARQLLDEAGWTMGAGGVREKGGEKLSWSFLIITSQEATATAQIVQQNLKDVGIETTITQTDTWAALQPTLLEGDYDIWLGGYGWGSPTILDFWFGRESASNVDHLQDPVVFDLLDQTGQAATIEERDAKYQELDKYLTEQAIWSPILFTNDLVAVNKRVVNYRFTPAGEQSFATDWGLAAE